MTMKKRHLNQRGMTLLELIVAMLIFTIAAMMLSTGFVSAFRYMKESSSIKNTSNAMQKQLDQEVLSEEELKQFQEIDNAQITYTLEDQSTISLTGTFRILTQYYDTTQSLTLGKMQYRMAGDSNNEQKGEQLYSVCEGWNTEWAKNVNQKVDKEFTRISDIIRSHYGGATITANNSLYRIYLFHGHFAELYGKPEGTWPQLDFSNITDELSILQQKEWYVKIYFAAPVLSDRIIYADNTNKNDSSWSGKQMFYINAGPGESEGSWYYNTKGKSYMMTEFSLSNGTKKYEWEDIKKIIRNEEDGWKKITYLK